MAIKPSDHGIVVEHKESGLRYAISDKNYNPDKVRKVRDLKPGESVHSYRPKKGRSVTEGEPVEDDHTEDVVDDSEETERAALELAQTEGSAPADAKDAK